MTDAPRITIEGLKRRMDAGEDFTMIDVRNPNAWGRKQPQSLKRSGCRLTGSKKTFRESQIPELVAYCTLPDEASSASLVRKLRERGCQSVWALQDGFPCVARRWIAS